MLKTEQITVLIVEDEFADVLLLERAFNQLDSRFALRVVKSAEEAIQDLEKSLTDQTQHPLPNLVVLDLRLPGMSGLELLSWIRQHPELLAIPKISLTGYGNRDLSRAYDLGLDFYLLKPLEIQNLAEVLRGLGLY